jgi:hypothetical protein
MQSPIRAAQTSQASQATPGRYLNVSMEDLGKMIGFIKTNYGGNREILHAEPRPLSSTAATPVSVPEVKPEMLGNIGAPSIDVAAYKPTYLQLASNLSVLKYLIKDPQVSKLIDQAIAENNLLKGAVNA